jgi:hypothetical protein
MAEDADTQISDEELDELVSHVLGLRTDFVRKLLADAGVSPADRNQNRIALRGVLRGGLADGTIDVADVVRFLDVQEPGGKQHVFVLRPRKVYNDRWKDLASVRRRLRRREAVRDLIDADLPLVMPDGLTLSSVRLLDGGIIEVVGVEARSYFDRDDRYDDETTSDDGLPVELRAYVQRVARSTVLLRWDVAHRHAALHITQATSRGVSRSHYRDVYERFAREVSGWLDMDKFREVNLYKVVQGLRDRERDAQQVSWTRSRRGRWETDDGGEIEAISAGIDASIYDDDRVAAAVEEVADDASGRNGNFYWLPRDGTPVSDELHLTVIPSDSRINFMIPSSPEAVAHVLQQVRSLL